MRRWLPPTAMLLGLAAVVVIAANRGATAWTPNPQRDGAEEHTEPSYVRGDADGHRTPRLQAGTELEKKHVDSAPGSKTKHKIVVRGLERVGSALKAYTQVLHESSGLEAQRVAEAAVRKALATLTPVEVVAVMRKVESPAQLDLVVRWLDRRLEEDRSTWEDALFMGMEEANRDAGALATLAELAEPRIEDASVRSAAARFLQKRATTTRLRTVLARFHAETKAEGLTHR